MATINVGNRSQQEISRMATKKRRDMPKTVNPRDLVLMEGIEVVEISESGKRQLKRLRLSHDRASLLIKSNKKKGGLKVFSKKKKDEDTGILIGVGSIYMVQPGQLTKKFELSLTVPQDSTAGGAMNSDNSVEDDFSTCSMYYKDREKNLSLSVVYYTNDNERATLDMIMSNQNEYRTFTNIISDLIRENSTVSEANIQNLDVVFLQRIVREFGNGNSESKPTDYINLRGITLMLETRLGVKTLKTSVLSKTYRNYCKSIKVKADRGLDYAQAVKFLQLIRTILNEQAGIKACPTTTLLNKLEKKSQDFISAEAFLEFLRSCQNEKDATLEEVKELFGRINAQLNADHISNGSFKGTVKVGSRNQITKHAFEAYLIGDSNDIFNPIRGQEQSPRHSKPLSNYWVYTSHNTFKDGDSASDGIQRALSRGCRSLELSVWDGAGKEKREPMVLVKYPLLEILKTIKGFIKANDNMYPIILSIENHCSLRVQNKVARYLRDVLGRSLFVPQTTDGPLPTLESLKGMVVVKGKFATDAGGATTIYDDYDADLVVEDTKVNDDDDDDGQELPFQPIFSIISEGPHRIDERTPEEMWKHAKLEEREAKKKARKIEDRAYRLEVKAAHAEEFATQLSAKLGRTKEAENYPDISESSKFNQIAEIEKRLELMELGSQASSDSDENSSYKVTKGTEVPRSFMISLEKTLAVTNEKLAQAEKDAVSANQAASVSLAGLQQPAAELSDAENALREAKQSEDNAIEASEEATSAGHISAEEVKFNEERLITASENLEESEELLKHFEETATEARGDEEILKHHALEAVTSTHRCRSKLDDISAKVSGETHLKEKYQQEAKVLKVAFDDANIQMEVAMKRKEQAESSLEKIDYNIKQLERLGQLSENMQTKHDLRDYCAEKVELATAEYASAEKISRHAKHSLTEAEQNAEAHEDKAADAAEKIDALQVTLKKLVEDSESKQEEERQHEVTLRRAEDNVKRVKAELSEARAELREAEAALKDSKKRAIADKEKAEDFEEVGQKATEVCDILNNTYEMKKRAKIDAEAANLAAQELKVESDDKLEELKKINEDITEVYQRAKRECNEEKYRSSVKKQVKGNLLNLQQRATTLREKANRAKVEAREAVTNAAEKAAAERHALSYKTKKEKVKPLSAELAKVTLLNGCKFKYWEKSLTLPYTSMHSVTETKMKKIIKQGPLAWTSWMEYNNDRITRTFPSDTSRRTGSNSNPMLPWAMGCQFVAMNMQTSGEELWLNDGRFRENGSSGYVLKPNLLNERGATIAPLKIQVLSGNRIPLPSGWSKLRKSLVALQVKVSIYDAAPGDTKAKTIHHTTKTLKGNCFNPVWNEGAKDCANFMVRNKSVAMVLFTVWDKKTEESKTDNFIAAAAIPFSCLRHGYRSVQLFDRDNSRCGDYASASLLVNVNIGK